MIRDIFTLNKIKDNVIWETTSKERQEFTNEFTNLTKDYLVYVIIPISWISDSRKPLVNEEFINKLPVDIQKSIKALITGL